jgi:anti-sigma regulatory factor (Ser/Thr protein kinase)
MRFSLLPTPQAPGEARRRLGSLVGRIDHESLAYLGMVVSELVAAGVAHGAAEPIELSILLDGDRVRGAVEDDGAGTRAVALARAREDYSLPLRIVDGLVDDWGTDEGGTRIWFDMVVQRPGPHQPPA